MYDMRRSFIVLQYEPQSEALEREKARLKEELRERVQDVMAQVEGNLLDKYCYVDYADILKRNRTRALKVPRTAL